MKKNTISASDASMHGAASKSNWALLALALATFGIGTTEFGPMGFLPSIAMDLKVSIPEAGQIVSIYALGVMLSGPVFTLLLARIRQRTALMLLMVIFTAGNLLSAVAPTYSLLMLARLFTSFNHGAFIGLGAVMASSLVPVDRRARAIAAMFMGITVANIGGVPAATWIGQYISWRWAFVGTAGLGVAAILALRLALPAGDANRAVNVKQELRVLAQPAVINAIAISALGSAAMFTLYTYIAPILFNVTGASKNYITASLILIGIGFTIGNGIGGRLADWSLERAARIILSTLALSMFALPFILENTIATAIGLLVWGAASFAIVPPLQMNVMQAAKDAPGLASSINAGAFNLGNALGAVVGAFVIGLDLNYKVVPIAGGVLAVASLLLTYIGKTYKKEYNIKTLPN